MPADLRAFLDAGEPPIYIGFGSMSFGSARNEAIMREALATLGRARRARQRLGRIDGRRVCRPTPFCWTRPPMTNYFPTCRRSSIMAAPAPSWPD